MAFSLHVDSAPDSPTRAFRYNTGSYTPAIGDLVQYDRTSDAYDVSPATSSTIKFDVAGVVIDTAPPGYPSGTLLAQLIVPGQKQLWVADTQNAANSNHNYLRAALQNQSTINNTGTDVAPSATIASNTGIFTQTGVYAFGGSTTKIIGFFNQSL